MSGWLDDNTEFFSFHSIAPVDWRNRISEKWPIGDPSDISDVVLFLASKESRWVSGSVVSTNRGGLTF
jgi:3-oxoacyl-[acyl-carrier protein] reductase